MIRKQFASSPIRISSPRKSCKNSQLFLNSAVHRVNTIAINTSAFSNYNSSLNMEVSKKNSQFFSPCKAGSLSNTQFTQAIKTTNYSEKYIQLMVDNNNICKQNAVLQDYLEKQSKNYDEAFRQIHAENQQLKKENQRILSLLTPQSSYKEIALISRLQLETNKKNSLSYNQAIANESNESQTQIENEVIKNKVLNENNFDQINQILKQITQSISPKKPPTNQGKRREDLRTYEKEPETVQQELSKQVQDLSHEVENLKEGMQFIQNSYAKDKSEWISQVSFLMEANELLKKQLNSLFVQQPAQDDQAYYNPIWMPIGSPEYQAQSTNQDGYAFEEAEQPPFPQAQRYFSMPNNRSQQ